MGEKPGRRLASHRLERPGAVIQLREAQPQVVEGHGPQRGVISPYFVKGGRGIGFKQRPQGAVGVGYVSIVHFQLLFFAPRMGA